MTNFKVSQVGQRALDFGVLLTFFLVPWWLRPPWIPRDPYTLGFLISLPLLASIILWVLLGLPGLRAALRDRRRYWLMIAALFLYWVMLSPQWSLYPEASVSAAQQFAFAAIFALVVLCSGPSARAIT